MRYAVALTGRLVPLGDGRAASIACSAVLDTRADGVEPPMLVLGGEPGAEQSRIRTIAYCDCPEDAERIAAALNAANGGPAHMDRCVARLESMGDQLVAALAELRRGVPKES